MKHFKTAAAMALVSVLFACEPAVTFTEPQPVDSDNLPSFPKRLRGSYINPANQATILITDKIMERSYDYERIQHPNELDSTTKIIGDTLLEYTDGTRLPFRVKGDSLVVHYHCVDTLFMIDYDNVLRKLKGYYFMNIRYGKTSWDVRKIGLRKGQLTIGSISSAADIANLQAITESNQDTVAPYHFTPDKKQFKKYVKADGFSDADVYLKCNQ